MNGEWRIENGHLIEIEQYVDLASQVKHLPQQLFRLSDDAQADVVYINQSSLYG
ncbi:MAG: hypothetical protein GDA56_01565 [Hormoscilla sp. GM7CHS1pb]|nr:hypothetical protein [Hormoscilla sp. GM7CHS1pb]